MISEQFSIKNRDIILLCGSTGKPYIKDLPIHFNISHAGDFVVCAISQTEIGIDIEQVRAVDLKIAKRFFHQSEYEHLLAQQKSNQLDYFYSLWTLKESYIKWLGTGLTTPLDSFYFNITDASILFVGENQQIMPFFKQFVIEDYKLAVCSASNDFPADIEQITIRQILDIFKILT